MGIGAYICTIKNEQRMNAQEKLKKITDLIVSGKTLVFSTYLKHVSVSPKTYASWAKSGHQLFKVKDDSIFIASGKSFLCIDGCKITIN